MTNRFEYITERAKTPADSWTLRELWLFHVHNPNGSVQESLSVETDGLTMTKRIDLDDTRKSVVAAVGESGRVLHMRLQSLREAIKTARNS